MVNYELRIMNYELLSQYCATFGLYLLISIVN